MRISTKPNLKTQKHMCNPVYIRWNMAIFATVNYLASILHWNLLISIIIKFRNIYLEPLLHTTSVILPTTLTIIQASHLLYVFLFLLIGMKNFQKCLVDVRLSLESVLKSWQNWINNVFADWLKLHVFRMNTKRSTWQRFFFTLILLT